ncbi:FKBP-type peptidyl-prolyl cis-trans isomerase [Aggregicoccus sp. 17bor-14]|uniref:FKBP-type peptidyl-prolyl cis-trans isomerase n=1 Tax=Myxococcaceae TaxID=31 RepID=UPI00129CE7BF|nr:MULTISPECIES: FKBP-type peptidyl-prolyl cis-trans isomerase [Myxococcaceae]MRI86573.1 FKBP-type peptidyl-prolyl cis-trans isomerase [Aggregicoccus sp. 17bor-14]
MRLLAAVALVGGGAWAQAPQAPQAKGDKGAEASAATPQSEDDKTVYAVGYQLGQALEAFDLTPAELALVQQAVADAIAGRTPAADLATYAPKAEPLRTERRQRFNAAFLARAAKEKGAQRTASGMIYTPLKVGTGKSPRSIDTVSVNYRGTLTDGREFDSSYKRGQAAEFPLNGVIKCWTEGVGMMKVGGRARLVCPPEIAYGAKGAQPRIPPNAVLVFEVELLDVMPPQG